MYGPAFKCQWESFTENQLIMCQALWQRQAERNGQGPSDNAKPQQTEQSHHSVLRKIMRPKEMVLPWWALTGGHTRNEAKLGLRQRAAKAGGGEERVTRMEHQSSFALKSRKLGQTDGGERCVEKSMSLGPFPEQGKRCQPKEGRDLSLGSGKTVWDWTPRRSAEKAALRLWVRHSKANSPPNTSLPVFFQ